MKTLCIFFFCLISAYSCKHSNIVRQTDAPFIVRLHEGLWYSNFKNEVFARCLKKIYPEHLSMLIDTTDGSTAANLEWLRYNHDVINVMDSLASAFAKRVEASWNIENRKVTMNVCLEYRNSYELDSIAVALYKKVQSEFD